jgi:hypothetical protein
VRNAEQEIIIPTGLKTYLNDIVESRFGYKLGEPWKYSEESLGVVVPILRENSPDRQYITMYEVLKELNIQDTGKIDQLDLQNKSGVAIFIRAGTIFTGGTQNRAAQHSGVFSHEKETINVRCVNASHGIRKGEEMVFGDIAPPSVTRNLMARDQNSVWDSVSNYTTEKTYASAPGAIPEDLPEDDEEEDLVGFSPKLVKQLQTTVGVFDTLKDFSSNPMQKAIEDRIEGLAAGIIENAFSAPRGPAPKRDIVDTILNSQMAFGIGQGLGSRAPELVETLSNSFGKEKVENMISSYRHDTEVKDLLSKIRKNQSVLDDMMQKVPLFDNQVGAIIFDPVGVIAVETFDHPKSWESIKKEIIEKYGDKIKEKQSDHLFELKPDAIVPAFRKFIEGLDKFAERIIRKDDFSETRVIIGKGIVGEYTLVKGQPTHVLLLKEEDE